LKINEITIVNFSVLFASDQMHQLVVEITYVSSILTVKFAIQSKFAKVQLGKFKSDFEMKTFAHQIFQSNKCIVILHQFR